MHGHPPDRPSAPPDRPSAPPDRPPRGAVADGAQEIDIVVSRNHALCGDWAAMYEEVSLFKEACGDAHMKAIIATGELGTYSNVHKASLVCMMAGSDFIKTSTGKEPTNASIPVSLVMIRALRDYYQATGHKVHKNEPNHS